MGWLDKLLGRRREPEAERVETRTSEATDEELEAADRLEEEIAAQRDENALRNPLPPGTG
jgi:hypothetical protein